jgi:hypothetical protein
MFVTLTGVDLLTLLPNRLTGVSFSALLAHITYDSSSRNRLDACSREAYLVGKRAYS